MGKIYRRKKRVSSNSETHASFAEGLSKIIDVLGWEFVGNYLMSDGKTINNFFVRLTQQYLTLMKVKNMYPQITQRYI